MDTLTPPTSARDDQGRVVNELQRDVELFEQFRSAAGKGDRSQIQKIIGLYELEKRKLDKGV